MEPITTTKVEDKVTAGGKAWQQITDDKGRKLSYWGDGKLEQNTSYRCIIKSTTKDGKTYFNIESFEKGLPETPKPTNQPANTSSVGALALNHSIESQVAAKLAGELWVSKTINEDHPVVGALIKWITTRL